MEETVVNAAQACQLLDWDTEFFGVKVAMVDSRRLTEAIVAEAFGSCEKWKVDCLYYLADCHHPPSVHLAERCGFHFVDIRLTFEYDLNNPCAVPAPSHGDGLTIRSRLPEDIPFLKAIAKYAYVHSRYYFDEGFSEERCQAFYTEWIEKSCCGYANEVLVAELRGRPVGYVSCQLRSSSKGAIELVGIAPDARGNSVGKALVLESLNWFRSARVESVEVVTQGRNYMAQRLYQRCGFVTKETQLWYHKWFCR